VGLWGSSKHSGYVSHLH